MNILVTGSGGLIGSEACFHWLKSNAKVHGIDNNCRKIFFGNAGDVSRVIESLEKYSNYTHHDIDIRDRKAISDILSLIKPDVIIHCAAQPSHDKAAHIPYDDFDTNTVGTFNLLESARNHCPKVVFIHVSTNKVYGDRPNMLPLIETHTRYDYDPINITKCDGVSILGINENFSIDQSVHSLFGASKLSADVIAQEYGRYFGMCVGIFRGGCLTGPLHAGVELHGFLSYIIKCAISGKHYTIFGYGGKQVRDQIHCSDVIDAFENFVNDPKKGEVYNIGGGKENAASILEIIDMLKNDHDLELKYSITNKNRVGDHICYYTDMSKFKSDYSQWLPRWSLKNIITEIIDKQTTRDGVH